MKLINKNTGTQIIPGDRVITFRGEKGYLMRAYPPQRPGSSGKVMVKIAGGEREYFPSVIGAEFREG